MKILRQSCGRYRVPNCTDLPFLGLRGHLELGGQEVLPYRKDPAVPGLQQHEGQQEVSSKPALVLAPESSSSRMISNLVHFFKNCEKFYSLLTDDITRIPS